MHHPNVCSVISARAWPPEYYLVFPYMARSGLALIVHCSDLFRALSLSPCLPVPSHMHSHLQENGSLGDLLHNQRWRPSRQVAARNAPAPPRPRLLSRVVPRGLESTQRGALQC